MKNSLRLSVLLVGLVGINVYVFFFNHKTAPRDVLNLQSTTKTMETSRREVLAADAREAREALAAEAATKRDQEEGRRVSPGDRGGSGGRGGRADRQAVRAGSQRTGGSR